jgi:hypothetical protein
MLAKGEFFPLFGILFGLPCEKWVNITSNMENAFHGFILFCPPDWIRVQFLFFFFWEALPCTKICNSWRKQIYFSKSFVSVWPRRRTASRILTVLTNWLSHYSNCTINLGYPIVFCVQTIGRFLYSDATALSLGKRYAAYSSKPTLSLAESSLPVLELFIGHHAACRHSTNYLVLQIRKGSYRVYVKLGS